MFTYFIYTAIDEVAIKTNEFTSDNSELSSYDNGVPFTLSSNQFIELQD